MRLSYTLLRILKEAIVMQMNNRVSPVSHKFFASLPFFNKCRKCAVCIAAGVLFIGEESALYNKFVRCELFFYHTKNNIDEKNEKTACSCLVCSDNELKQIKSKYLPLLFTTTLKTKHSKTSFEQCNKPNKSCVTKLYPVRII